MNSLKSEPNTECFTLDALTREQTTKIADEFASNLYSQQKLFIALIGEVGAGKTTFAQSFIAKWLEHNNESLDESIQSPTYNLVKVYGEKRKIAHLDLYRLKEFEELEQIGYEHYFYNDMNATVVEWLDQIPNFKNLIPKNFLIIEIELNHDDHSRLFKIQIADHLKSFLKF